MKRENVINQIKGLQQLIKEANSLSSEEFSGKLNGILDEAITGIFSDEVEQPTEGIELVIEKMESLNETLKEVIEVRNDFLENGEETLGQGFIEWSKADNGETAKHTLMLVDLSKNLTKIMAELRFNPHRVML